MPRWKFEIDHVPNSESVLDGMVSDALTKALMRTPARLAGAVSITVTYYQPDMRIKQEKVGGSKRTNMLLDCIESHIESPHIVGTDIRYRSQPLKEPCVEVRITGYSGGAVPM